MACTETFSVRGQGRTSMNKWIDFHTHVLPAVDDGSTDLQMSVSMLEQAWEQGVTTVVATPHFYAHNDKPDDFLARRAEAFDQLQQCVAGREDVPALKLGAEVYYYPSISDSAVLSDLTIGSKAAILIEMPATAWTDDMYRELEQIYIKQGLTPVIAHIDRYLTPFNSYKILKNLSKLPVLIQVNAGFFINPKTQKKALSLLRKGKIQFLGSDCHDLQHRGPNMQGALEVIAQHLGESGLAYLQNWQSEIL